MKIAHICLCGGYTPNFNYQENLLTKYHARLGHKVKIITSLSKFEKGKKIEDINIEFINEDYIFVKRLKYKYNLYICKKLGIYNRLYEELKEFSPDILFIHNLQFLDILIILKYLKRNKKITVYIDNHADFSNSATTFVSKHLLHSIVWKFCARKINPYVKKWYGVLPARCNFLNELYGIPKEKIELLVMGGDDDKLAVEEKKKYKYDIRRKFKIKESDFLLVTGGKIDRWKTDILLLMDIVNELVDVSLIIFGSIDKSIEEEFKIKCSSKVKYVGWANIDEAYEYFFASDLVVFPGRHSVYWEQAVSQGKPLLVKYFDGYSHIDLGGNVDYLKKMDYKEVKEKITSLIFTDDYFKLKKAANSIKKEKFYYSNIAKKSLEADEIQ